MIPDSGHARIPGDALYCQQRTDNIPATLRDLVQAADANACELKGRLAIEDSWLARWETLSHGERKRAQIGVALWRQPHVLAVDEPTNHIDAEARAMLTAALRSFRGIGLLVSHDRELLDTLCRQCLFIEPPHATMRPGGFTKGARQTAKEKDHVRKQLEVAKRASLKLKREMARRREEASRSHRRRSKRGLNVKDHDARDKIDRARVTGKDGVAGKLLRQLDGRLRQAREQQDRINVEKSYKLGLWLPGSRSQRDALFRLPAGEIPVGNRRLTFPELVMRPDDRIALTGPNGAGKSTLVRHIVASLTIPDEHVTYLPQEIDLRETEEIMSRIRSLPNDKLGHIMTVVSRLGSRVPRLLESTEPSPGETRKILLALGIAHKPHLIIMDEPTNHLDLPSIECLENALSDCPCGLLLVSHDQRFLDRLTKTRWHIGTACYGEGDAHMTIESVVAG